MAKYRVNKKTCIGCKICINRCPGSTTIEPDGKSKVIDNEKLDKCGGEMVCPYGAIEKISE